MFILGCFLPDQDYQNLRRHLWDTDLAAPDGCQFFCWAVSLVELVCLSNSLASPSAFYVIKNPPPWFKSLSPRLAKLGLCFASLLLG